MGGARVCAAHLPQNHRTEKYQNVTVFWGRQPYCSTSGGDDLIARNMWLYYNEKTEGSKHSPELGRTVRIIPKASFQSMQICRVNQVRFVNGTVDFEKWWQSCTARLIRRHGLDEVVHKEYKPDGVTPESINNFVAKYGGPERVIDMLQKDTLECIGGIKKPDPRLAAWLCQKLQSLVDVGIVEVFLEALNKLLAKSMENAALNLVAFKKKIFKGTKGLRIFAQTLQWCEERGVEFQVRLFEWESVERGDPVSAQTRETKRINSLREQQQCDGRENIIIVCDKVVSSASARPRAMLGDS